MTQRTTRGNRPTFVRLDEQERAEAQEAADALFDGNLSMFLRKAARDAVTAWRKSREDKAA